MLATDTQTVDARHANRDTLLADIHSAVADLTERRTHVEGYWVWTSARHRRMHAHRTEQASLLDQMRAQVAHGTTDTAATGAASPDGRPPLALEVLDRLMATEAAAARWVIDWLALPGRDTPEANLRAMLGAAGTLDSPDLRAMAADVGRWRSWAEILTGWRTPPWRPQAPCPLCERTALVIRLDSKTALCGGCGNTWDEATIALLADHIRELAPAADLAPLEPPCAHSWRLTLVTAAGVEAVCARCTAAEVRQSWPKGTPVWDDLDAAMMG